ncbi:8440_t:CDS:2 [Diversispora eburnea]|uniref:Peptide hydrolase n=1 Tax=Diversispora eburnea TaxID=1213867 RepID=A0A9N9AE62_9GLOM|nr:8440_t:CDS:2 [Diversispora eburnea]
MSQDQERTPLLSSNDNDEELRRQFYNRRHHHYNKKPYGLLALIGLLFSIILFISFIPRNDPDAPEEILWPRDLTKNIFAHLRAFNEIANQSTRNSRSIVDGFNASAEYVIGKINETTSCEIKKQYFKVPIWEKEKEAELNVTLDNNETIIYQAANLVLQNVTEILNPCDDEDEKWEVEGKVALIKLGGKCDIWESAYKSEKSGASAVIFYNSQHKTKLSYTRVRKDNWKEGDPLMTIPVLAASYSLGQILGNAKNINITTYTKIFTVDTFNVLCYLNKYGNKEDTIVIGSHLDSVPAGPGLVDNASGSSTILEILLYLEKHRFRSKNRLIFAWWGAEEIGLMGSAHFVRELINTGEIDNVAMNLNFDMLGSPNYIFFILRGSDAPEDARNGSIKIQRVFENNFHGTRKHYDISDMLRGSDFLPFIQNGIPSGIANAPLDTCYHQSCDTIENINVEAIRVV